MACGFDELYILAFFTGVVATVAIAAAIHYVVVFQRATTVQPGWKDPERGEGAGQDQGAFVESICGKFRTVVESQMRKGSTVQELEDRLDSLLKVVEEAAVPTLRESAMPVREVDTDEGRSQLPSKGSVDTRTPSSSNRSGSTDRDGEDLPGLVAPPDKPGKEPMPPPLPPANLEPIKAEASRPSRDAPPKQFGPTNRQSCFLDPPEKCYPLNEEDAQRHSLLTLQRVLSKRDAQTTELHRQLRETRQQLWQQTAEARAATARLHAYLADGTRAPHEQAEAILRLQGEVKDLSSRLAEARQQEQQWAVIASRQRAFFRQSEVLAQEGLQILRRHPAGEIFLAPPPVVLEDDEFQEEPMWDVGTSHCNPYCVDSWPFEPNVLAAKASVQPNLNQWDEGREDDEDSVDANEDSDPHWHYDSDYDREGDEDEFLDHEPGLSKVPLGRIDLPPLTAARVPVGDASARSL